MKKIGVGFGLLVGVAAIVLVAIGPDWRRLLANPPMDNEVLFWSQAQRDAGFRMLDRVSFMIETRDIPAGGGARPLPEGPALDLGIDLDAYLEDQRHAGLVVLHNGAVRLEAYRLDFSEKGRWTSFSVAKSFTSTLVGAAMKDGYIRSFDDPISDYIAGLKGSAYDDVTVEQLLTMTSGVAWNEDYDDPNSDVARFNFHVAEDGSSNLVSYMKTLSRAHPPGEVWRYSTGETNLIGVLVSEATGRQLADYLSEKIWRPYGMGAAATWLLNEDGSEISGCCIQAATRDFARFGQFMLDGAAIDGEPVVPDDWIARATTKRVGIGHEGHGYGYQWWTYDDGAYAADGIFGQGIFIDPNRNIVIATNSSWSSALGDKDKEHATREDFYRRVVAAIDAEAQ